MSRFRWQDCCLAIIGLWLTISPFVLGYDLPYPGKLSWISWNFILSGTAVFTVSVLTAINDRLWQKWAQIIIGVLALSVSVGSRIRRSVLGPC